MFPFSFSLIENQKYEQSAKHYGGRVDAFVKNKEGQHELLHYICQYMYRKLPSH